MQIIPQEPVLFSGTIRSNLDIEEVYTDNDVWEVLDRIGLKTYVSSLDDKLESAVVENGDNLSLGQRQLLCLGRAILVTPKILVMDEATVTLL
jgi:ATP-binding cassette, subfamily C (CFTR/MRP), member 1